MEKRFNLSEMFSKCNIDKIKNTYNSNPEKFNHGSYYSLLLNHDKECVEFLLAKNIEIKYPCNFYKYVTINGNLEYLKWIHQEKGIELNAGCYWGAGTYGYYDIIEYLVDNNCPYDDKAIGIIKYGCGGEEADHKKCWEYFKTNVLDK